MKYLPSEENARKWLKNAGIFAVPALLVFLVAIQGGAKPKDAMYAVYLWGLNTAIDLLRKSIKD